MQLRCRHRRPQRGQHQQKGSLALRQLFLRDHSRYTPLAWTPALRPSEAFSQP